MYQTSDNYKSKVYEASTIHLLKIYINGNKIEDRYIKGLNSSFILFTGNEFSLGATVAQEIKLEIDKRATPEKINSVYIESGIEGETIPIGNFRLEDLIEENKHIYTLKLIDDMVKFEFNYDGSFLNYPCTVLRVLQDICLKAGVELRFYFFFKLK